MASLKSKADWFVSIRAQDADSVLRSVHKYLGSRNALGDTALITAVRAQDVQMSSLLLPFEHALLDNRGYSALAIAIEMDAPEMVCLLAPLEKNVPIPGYSSPIALAASCGAFRALRILTTFVSDVSTEEHESALEQVARTRHFPMAEVLLETQAYTNQDLANAYALCEGSSGSATEFRRIIDLAIKFAASGSILNLHSTLKVLHDVMEENTFLVRALRGTVKNLHSVYLAINNRGSSIADNKALNIISTLHQCTSADGAECGGSSSPRYLQNKRSTSPKSSSVEEVLTSKLSAGPIPSAVIVSKAIAHNYLETEDGKRLSMEVANMQALIGVQKDALKTVKNTLRSVLTAFYAFPGCNLQPCEEDRFVTPLMQAVVDRDMEAFLRTIFAYAGRRNSQGETALMLAARSNNLIAIRILADLEYGMRDNKGKTALRHALDTRNADSVAALIDIDRERYSEKDRETGWTCTDGKTCLSVALEQNMAFVYKYLASREIAIHIGNLEIDGIGIIQEASPLMLAVQRKRLEAVMLLAPVSAGYADPTKKCTALMLAASLGDTSAARVLAQYETGMQDFQGYTAMMYAADHNHADIVELLLPTEARMTTNSRSGWGSGRTALMAAAYSGSVDAVLQLIPYEAGITQAVEPSDAIQQYAGWSALVWAAASPYASLACIDLIAAKEPSHAKKALDEVLYWREDRQDIKQVLAPYIAPQRPSSRRSQHKRRKSTC